MELELRVIEKCEKATETMTWIVTQVLASSCAGRKGNGKHKQQFWGSSNRREMKRETIMSLPAYYTCRCCFSNNLSAQIRPHYRYFSQFQFRCCR